MYDTISTWKTKKINEKRKTKMKNELKEQLKMELQELKMEKELRIKLMKLKEEYTNVRDKIVIIKSNGDICKKKWLTNDYDQNLNVFFQTDDIMEKYNDYPYDAADSRDFEYNNEEMTIEGIENALNTDDLKKLIEHYEYKIDCMISILENI